MCSHSTFAPPGTINTLSCNIETQNGSTLSASTNTIFGPQCNCVLELGSGTGLVSLAVACSWPIQTLVATDIKVHFTSTEIRNLMSLLLHAQHHKTAVNTHAGCHPADQEKLATQSQPAPSGHQRASGVAAVGSSSGRTSVIATM